MKWNWQQPKWANFECNTSAFKKAEETFLHESLKLIGATSIITEDEQNKFKVELMSEEALKSSKIEGELLSRDSVASSLLRQLGLAPELSDHQANDKEKGIAALIVNNYQTFAQPLTHEMLFNWHLCVVEKSWLIKDIGKYRTSLEPMQVVSGYEGLYKVHFEAPPAQQIASEMDKFIQWFNDTAPNGKNELSPLIRAGIAHLYFVSIHPFEDGNGRIGRAISEKALAQSLGKPALLALSHAIEKERAEYYKQLKAANKGLNIDNWLNYFSQTAIKAVEHAEKLIHFVLDKARLYDRMKGKLNERQNKVIGRILANGLDGFEGGLNAKKYMKMTGALERTATRDLQKLVELGVLTKTGERKGTRYWIAFEEK